MKDISREKIYGMAATVVFHLLLLLVLYFIVMEQIPLQPEKSNIEMQGASEDVAGEEFFEAKVLPEVETVSEVEQAAPSKVVEEPLIAQNEEPSIPVDTLRPEKKNTEPVLSEEEKKRIEEKKRRERISKSVAGSFGKSNLISTSGGEDVAEDLSVNPAGDDGIGDGDGAGAGIDVNVGNRTVISMNRNIPVQEEGVVVVAVRVNSDGNVVEANAKGSSLTLRKAAEKEAYKVKFNKVANQLEDDRGTITFRFKMNY